MMNKSRSCVYITRAFGAFLSMKEVLWLLADTVLDRQDQGFLFTAFLFVFLLKPTLSFPLPWVYDPVGVKLGLHIHLCYAFIAPEPGSIAWWRVQRVCRHP